MTYKTVNGKLVKEKKIKKESTDFIKPANGVDYLSITGKIKGGWCTRSARCGKSNATEFNVVTKTYYCKECAERIRNDVKGRLGFSVFGQEDQAIDFSVDLKQQIEEKARKQLLEAENKKQ